MPSELRGTYLGICHPLIIEHLKSLGITSVQLMPVAAFMSEPRLEQLGLTNYWGYNPIAFFAPEPRYAAQEAVTEFKTMVRELHKAGLEVILDVVYNHTAESGFDGPMLSFKGFDNAGYYAFEAGARPRLHSPRQRHRLRQQRQSGSPQQPAAGARRPALLGHRDAGGWLSLRSGGHPGAGGGRVRPHGAFFKAMMADPVLARVKLIAEPWDIGPFGYRLGQFPSQWLEINDRYRDTVRAFWRGDAGKMGTLPPGWSAHGICSRRTGDPHTSVNYLCYHDGFTLEDLVSYNQRHNQANGEDNRDGHGNNLSNNHGVEGPTLDPRVNNLRQQQKRNLIATLLLSQGTPHFLAGDEMGRSQLGNNNAYCQDNQISWVNWQWRGG